MAFHIMITRQFINCNHKVEEEYRSHLRAEHDLTPEELEDEQGVRVPKINSQGKMKSFKCKQCDYSTVTKVISLH